MLFRSVSSTNTNGSYKSGEVIYIEVIYSDASIINLSGTNLSTDYYLNLDNGAKAYFDSQTAYSAGKKKITFKYTVGLLSTENVDLLNVISGSLWGNVAIKDAALNPADQTLPVGTSTMGNYTINNDTANNSITVTDSTTGTVLVTLDLNTLQ